jgi:SAM-dependent methyltransferase
MIPRGARRVLDLGAGTGELTALLADTGLEVVAVEPDATLREQLAALAPKIAVHAGSAEHIPLGDATVDAVTVAQAWHWFDTDTATREIARVLVPAGTLSLVWNVRDESEPWAAELGALMHRYTTQDIDTIAVPGAPFGDPERLEDVGHLLSTHPTSRTEKKSSCPTSPGAPVSDSPEPMTGAPVIRRLGVADAEAYRAFRLTALRDTPTAFTSSFLEENSKPLSATAARLAIFEPGPGALIGAFNPRGELVGSAGLDIPGRGQERHKATLFGMAVLGTATGRGVGRALVKRILQIARADERLYQVALTVSEHNEPAMRLYTSCGFAVWGREPRAVVVDGTAVAKLHMVLMLDDAPPA